MVSSEILLILKILQYGDFRTILKNRITQSMFSTSEGRAGFRFLWEYYHHPKHPGCIPQKKYFLDKFPAFPKNVKPKETLPELCERVRDVAISRKISSLNDEVATLAMSDPYKSIDILRDGLTKVQGMTARSNSILLSDMADELVNEYELVSKHGGMTGIPFPWEQLNIATGGMHEEDFILMYADHKTMKSFLGLYIACWCYKYAHRRVLYYAAEMNRRLISRRTATCYCKLDYQKVKRGKLAPGQKEMYLQTVRQLRDWENDTEREGRVPRFYIVKNDGGPTRKNGVYQLMAEIEAFEPDVVFADSFYRMADDYDWKVQANLTKQLKETAERYRIPIVGITQRNRGKDRGPGDRGMGDIGYTLAGAQETDLGFRIVYDGENADGTVRMHFVIAAAREIKQKGFTIDFSPYSVCRWVGWLSEEDLENINRKQKNKNKKQVEDEGTVHKAAAEVYGKALQDIHRGRQ